MNSNNNNQAEIVNNELLTAEDLLNLQVEENPFTNDEISLCTLCSWTSSQTQVQE